MTPPFRSRPHIRRPSDPADEDADNDDVIDGVIEEEPEQALVPMALSQTPPDDAIPRRRSRELSLPRVVRPDVLFVAIILILGGVFFTLLNTDSLSEAIVDWWPLVTLAGAAVYAFGALLRRHAVAFLGGMGVAGISLSLLLDTQDVAPFEETLVGIILVTLGVAIMVRGLLLRPARSVHHARR
ncbi:MAG: hypothetical protein GYB66_10245 [Chloroflexi bacterium]|nr:hypothetical protein [Chloroflexota bacterium]